MRHKWIENKINSLSKNNSICSICGCQKIYSVGSGRLSHYVKDDEYYNKTPKCLN